MLARAFAREPIVHDPQQGRIQGTDALGRYARQQAALFDERRVSRRMIRTIGTPHHLVEEVELELDLGGYRVPLPVAIVGERQPDGRLLEVRVYHEPWPPETAPPPRLPLVPVDAGARPPGQIDRLLDAMSRSDVDAALATFEHDARIYDLSSPPSMHRGEPALRAYFDGLFAHRYGATIEVGTVADDGAACAVEFNVVQHQGAVVRASAAIAVFIRGKGGQITLVRLYDSTTRVGRTPLARRP